jgi:hypothetical protein
VSTQLYNIALSFDDSLDSKISNLNETDYKEGDKYNYVITTRSFLIKNDIPQELPRVAKHPVPNNTTSLVNINYPSGVDRGGGVR